MPGAAQQGCWHPAGFVCMLELQSALCWHNQNKLPKYSFKSCWGYWTLFWITLELRLPWHQWTTKNPKPTKIAHQIQTQTKQHKPENPVCVTGGCHVAIRGDLGSEWVQPICCSGPEPAQHQCSQERAEGHRSCPAPPRRSHWNPWHRNAEKPWGPCCCPALTAHWWTCS